MVGALSRARHEDPENRPQTQKHQLFCVIREVSLALKYYRKNHICLELIVPFLLICQVVATGGKKNIR